MTVDFTKGRLRSRYMIKPLFYRLQGSKHMKLFQMDRNYYQNDSFEFRCRRGVAGCDCLTTSSMIAYYDGVQVHAGLIEGDPI